MTLSPSLTVAAGGSGVLRHGLYTIYLGEICEIIEMPGGVGPDQRYKLYELQFVPECLWRVGWKAKKTTFAVPQRVGKYTFEGFRHDGTTILHNLYYSLQEAIVQWVSKYEMIEERD